MFEAASKLGLDFYVPIYSDLSFKLDFPGKKYGRIDIFGIAGKSNMKLWDSSKDSTEWRYSDSGEDITFGSDFATFAISHLCFFSKKTRLKTSLSMVISQNTSRTDTFYLNENNKTLQYGEKAIDLKYTLSGSLRRKINKKNVLETGYYLDFFQVDYKDSVLVNTGFQTLSDTKVNMTMLRNYLQWQHKFTDDLTLNTGINSQYLFYNSSYSIEPRAGIKWDINNIHTLSFGTGLHSQMQPRVIYFFETQTGIGSYIQTNNNLDFTKSIHLILGYDYLISENMRLKAETYYQYLYDIPIKEEGFPQYSLINSGGDFWVGREDSLVNKGSGENLGLDLTVERFFKTNYYYLITVSLFNSTYKGNDGIERNTSFNQNFLINIVGGYECIIREKNFITINLKNVFAGGKRYVPIDPVASGNAGETRYNWNDAYSKRYKNFFRTDLRIGYKINMQRMSFEIAADLQNITNSKQPFMEFYDPTTGKIKSMLQFGFLPMLTMKIEL